MIMFPAEARIAFERSLAPAKSDDVVAKTVCIQSQLVPQLHLFLENVTLATTNFRLAGIWYKDFSEQHPG